MALTAAEAVRGLVKMLPKGAAWPRYPGTTIYKILLAVADEMSRVFGRADDAMDESHPATIDELLSEWETELGLPDPCVTEAQTEAERRAAIAAKLLAQGGQSREYFIGVADALGYTITIEETFPFIVGVHGCTDPVGDIQWRFSWIVHADAGLTMAQRDLLECTILGIKPAHTEVYFEYA